MSKKSVFDINRILIVEFGHLCSYSGNYNELKTKNGRYQRRSSKLFPLLGRSAINIIL